MAFRDEWPDMPDGSKYDGKQLLNLVRCNKSPFHGVWDVKLLIREIEENLNTEVIDIPALYKGSNNYGFHVKLSNRPDILARLARGDVNMPDFDGFPIHEQAPEAEFEAATYQLLRSEPDIRASSLLYSRIPVQYADPGLEMPKDIAGRRLFLFEKAEGDNNVWEDLNPENKGTLLAQLACIRAALFQYNPPSSFVRRYLHARLFKFMPQFLRMPVAPTREFWISVFESKIEATIRNMGDMIGWEEDEEVVGPIAFAAKNTLLSAIPYLLPAENAQGALYRFVLDHGDFGIHNTSIKTDSTGQPLVTSLYDWETGCIVPALLSDPLVAAGPVDVITDEDARPALTRVPKNATPADLAQYTVWAEQYIKELFHRAPDYEIAIRAGKDARHLWFALRDWRGGDSEAFFGALAIWAEKRMRELRVVSAGLADM